MHARRTFPPDTSGQRDAHNNKHKIKETRQNLFTPKLTPGAWDKVNEPAKSFSKRVELNQLPKATTRVASPRELTTRGWLLKSRT